MPRHHAVAANPEASRLDAKARRKLEDQRRMAFRRAIELYNEERRLDQEIHDYPELIAVNYVRALRAEARRQPGA
ncbi:transcriptional regulator [Pseudomonas sp. A-1]|uniref:PA3496 family putative envelope integrity protein n=1 Tax=Pseudomonas sp. A-1 TaxID=1821274 RepID=UPI0010A5BE3F|nr:transcriptional regulator [Pseudomonas sp. A-1]THG77031.1 transcriptional regulator [Pseudomonas sp. A-1]